MAIMLHAFEELKGYVKPAGKGIYIGGIAQARELIAAGKAVPKDFKFFFNGIQWEPDRLAAEVAQGRWDIVLASPDLILKQGTGNTLWTRARRELTASGGVV